MFLRKIFAHGDKEREVVARMESHIALLAKACATFMTALEKGDRSLMWEVIDFERRGDAIRRQILSKIYEGAFLPYLRPDLCKFVEIVDDVFDLLEDAAYHFLELDLPAQLRDDCSRVAFLNLRTCEMLLITFRAMIQGRDLREKTLAVRIYEKKVDDIKFDLIKEVRDIPIASFWRGKTLSDFVASITRISDIIEDASDYLQIIGVSMK